MKVDVANVNKVEKRLTVSIPSNTVSSKIDKAYLDLRKNVKLRGFRPGKAPVSILQRHFKSQVEEDVISDIVKETYPKALKEINATPVSQPKIENGVLEKGNDFSYTAVFEIKPEIDVKDYFGLKLEKKKNTAVTDEDADKEIDALRNSFATMKGVEDRVSKTGDCVIFDFDGTVEGKPYPGSSQKNFSMELSGDSFLPGFQDHLTGLEKGAEKTFSISVPEDYQNTDIAGKKVDFKVEIKEVKEKILPNPDDEFAKDVGNYKGLADLKIKIKESIAEKRKTDLEIDLKEEIFNILIAKNPLEIPKAMVETQIRNMIINAQQMLGAQGLKLEDMGQSIEQLFEQYRKPAERQVRSALLLEAVADKENLTADNEDFEKEFQRIADQTKQDIANVKAKISRDMIQPQILEQKAIKLITSKADITEK